MCRSQSGGSQWIDVQYLKEASEQVMQVCVCVSVSACVCECVYVCDCVCVRSVVRF